MKKITIGCSPLTNTIFAGHLIKDGTMWGVGKQDVTDQAVSAVAHCLLSSKTGLSFTKNGKEYMLRTLSKEEQSFLEDNFKET